MFIDGALSFLLSTDYGLCYKQLCPFSTRKTTCYRLFNVQIFYYLFVLVVLVMVVWLAVEKQQTLCLYEIILSQVSVSFKSFEKLSTIAIMITHLCIVKDNLLQRSLYLQLVECFDCLQSMRVVNRLSVVLSRSFVFRLPLWVKAKPPVPHTK